jgi:CubicO group peptidase (beta-lactamase class C family)
MSHPFAGRSWQFIFCLLAGSLSACAQQPSSYSPETQERIRQVENHLTGWVLINGSTGWTLEERMKFYHVHGLSIAVVKNFRIDYAKGYGWADSAEHRPVSPATLFQAGSISKSLNSVGVLKLAQSGKLDLYADINQYLKSWQFPYDSLARGKKISTANLLSHTAGLSVHGFPGYRRGDSIPTLPEVLDGKRPANTEAVRSQFAPSLKFQYSGGGTTISQLIVQDISGLPYAQYMGKEVLQPLGMTSSSYEQPPPARKKEQLATAYYNDGKEVIGKYHIYPEQAAAGLWTNPTDLSKYIIETQQSLEGKSAKVLDQKMTRLRLTPYVDSNAAFGAFILTKGNRKYFNHGGVDEGFVSIYYGSMEGGDGLVIMANTYSTAILDEIANSVAAVYGWEGFSMPQRRNIVPVGDSILASYVGNYEMNKDTFHVAKQGDALFIEDKDSHMKIYFISDSEGFIYEAENLMIQFSRDSRGKIDGMNLTRGSNRMRGIKLP